MKRQLIVLSLCVFTFLSCKKDILQDQRNEESNEVFQPTMPRFTSRPKLSTRGHLAFTDESHFLAFVKELRTSTKQDAFKNYDTLGFVSLASTIYPLNSTSLVDSGDVFRFIVPSDSIVEIQNVLYKPVENMTRLISISVSNLNSSSESSLNASVFNSTYMNKFVLNSTTTDNLGLFDYVQSHSSGYTGSGVTPDAIGRKMFGSTTTTSTTYDPPMYNGVGQCVQQVITTSQTTTYFFWIANHHNPVFVGSYFIPATNCN